MNIDRLISQRARAIDASGIRKVFDLGAKLKDPINLSIGQPDFPVPEPLKHAAAEAIAQDRNGYTVTQGIPALKRRIAQHLVDDLGWPAGAGEPGAETGIIVTCGTSGALHIGMLSVLEAGDEIIIPDPYFVAYPHMATLCGARAVRCDTYPDFRMTAERLEPLITARTKAVLLDSPGNPSGVVMSARESRDVQRLCREKGVLLISDEIYDEFCFADAREPAATKLTPRCPSPARVPGAHESTLLVRGFGKTYGCTGWRMGWCAGPRALIEQMSKMQQYSFVCAPAPLQWACLAAFEVSMEDHVARFARRRDRVMSALAPLTEVARPGGAFYAFVKVPQRLGITGTEFCSRAIERNLLIIPGGVFSDRDTHFRLSFAAPDDRLEQGLEIIAELMRA